jgi:DNA ligase-1
VFELGFEGINRSARHKSGIAVRFPRMLRIRDDKPLWEADSMTELEGLLAVAGPRRRLIRSNPDGPPSSSARRFRAASLSSDAATA